MDIRLQGRAEQHVASQIIEIAPPGDAVVCVGGQIIHAEAGPHSQPEAAYTSDAHLKAGAWRRNDQTTSCYFIKVFFIQRMLERQFESIHIFPVVPDIIGTGHILQILIIGDSSPSGAIMSVTPEQYLRCRLSCQQPAGRRCHLPIATPSPAYTSENRHRADADLTFRRNAYLDFIGCSSSPYPYSTLYSNRTLRFPALTVQPGCFRKRSVRDMTVYDAKSTSTTSTPDSSCTWH